MRKAKFSSMIIAASLVILAVSAVPAGAQVGVWRDINPTAYISPPANPQLNSVYMLSSNEGWAVGDSRPNTEANTTTTTAITQTSVSKANDVPTTVTSATTLTNIDAAIGVPAIFHYDGATWNLVPAPKFPDFPYKSSSYNLTSVTFGPPQNPISRNDGWTVGFNSTVDPPNALALHWDGVTWRVQIAGLSGPNAGPLWSAFMISPTDIWAVGQSQIGTPCAGTVCGVFWHWTGVPGLGGGWNLPQAPVKDVVFYSIFMVSATEGWAVGTGGAIYHYFAGTWTPFASPVTITGGALRSVYMLSATDGWAVGDNGVILHYTTGIWTGPVSPGTTSNNLLSVFMVSSTEGWAVGNSGTILHYSGATWTALPINLVPTAPVSSFRFASVFLVTASDGWSVGTAGVILHYDGANWGTVTSPTLNALNSVSFGPPFVGPFNPNDGWAVGNASTVSPFEPTIYHWNGFMWTKGVVIGTKNDLRSVFMLSSGDVWAVGGGSQPTASCSSTLCPVILHYTGGSWNTITPPPGSYRLNSVFMVSPTEGWAVGAQLVPSGSPAGTQPAPIILHYTVTGGVGTWAIFPAPATPPPIYALNSVFMLGPNEGWAVGDNATILHYTVTGGVGTWNIVTVSGTPGLSPSANLTSVFMLSPTSGWAVGGIKPPPFPNPGFFSAGPVIIYWDGTKWTPVATPNIPGGGRPILKSVYLTSANDGWAVGNNGTIMSTIFHWDGTAWNHITLSPALLGQIPPVLNSVFMTSPTNGWIVGGPPRFTTITTNALSTILRFAPFGGVATGTSTTTVVSTITTSTTGIITSTTSTSTSVISTNTTLTITKTSTVTPGGIPGFPVESIIAGIAIGLLTLTVLRRRRRRNAAG